jgi:hypothetical protein
LRVKQGDRIRLTEKVLHAEFRGLCGTIIKVIKSRGMVAVQCENGKQYHALLKNVETLDKKGVD